ncbi:ATP-binding protein [Aquisalimonas sp.]|uniref:ATP-binding protein n=1 Tax=Aquisalimonas sp. TaxID=1872621 RepID=UPI0025C31650|nr:ATP-binding protein [Aquisalimonas sp.]
MQSDPRIAAIRRRIRNWLPEGSGGAIGDGDPIEGLDADLTALESQLQALVPSGRPAGETFKALREQAILRTVLEAMVEGVVVADMDGRFLVFNQAARDLLGRGPTDAGPEAWSEEFGLFLADGVTPCPAAELPLSRSLQGASIDDKELVIRTPARPAEGYISVSARPLWGRDGTQVGAVVVFHDITGIKRAEQERNARESAEAKSRAKSEFLANMSHEIRTPLSAVLGFADLLLEPELTESDRLNYIQSVRRNGEHLLALIGDVLDLSKINANKLEVEYVECSLHQVLHEVASAMQVRAYDKGLKFDLIYETPIPALIHSDPMRVRQILLNLLSNAIKFTGQGGVVLSARCLDPGTDSSRLELAVTDTGIGLSDAEIDELFQPFHQANPSTTRQYGGSGLGLAICRSLAEVLGGEIHVRSAPGEGSTFTFTLYQPIDAHAEMVDAPSVTADQLEADGQATEASRRLNGRILLAEDGVDNQLLLSTILRRRGLEVAIAENGEDAVAHALEALNNSAPFDLILMDMQMPKLDGYGATAKLRSKRYSGPIVALTAHAMAGERERCMAAGCNDYLSKPIARQELLAAVESYLLRDPPAPAPTVALASESGLDDSTSPLQSSYADDPDMADVVAGFVERLPAQIRAMRSVAADGEFDHLKRLAHQLKGAAGGYGFMPISREAESLEAAAREATQAGDVNDAVNRLASLCDRVRSG